MVFSRSEAVHMSFLRTGASIHFQVTPLQWQVWLPVLGNQRGFLRRGDGERRDSGDARVAVPPQFRGLGHCRSDSQHESCGP